GATDRTAKLAQPLAERARTLIADATKRMEKRVDEIEKSAVHKGRGRSTDGERYHGRAGTTSTQRQELNDMIATCDQIAAASERLSRMFGSLGAGKADFATAAKPAADVRKHADEVLKIAAPKTV